MANEEARTPRELDKAGQGGNDGQAQAHRTPGHPHHRLNWLLAIAGAIGIGAVGTAVLRPSAGDAQRPLAPLLAIEKMGHLVSLKLNYAEIVEFNEKRALGIPWSQWEFRMAGTKVLLVAKGDCSVATDLRAAKYEKVDPTNHTLVVSLPSPQPFQPRINHDGREKGGSYFYAITNRGVEAIIPGSSNRNAAINHALTWAQDDVKRACGQQQILDSARENAETGLSATFQATGWKPTFVWR
jgi:hypothetical protein